MNYNGIDENLDTTNYILNEKNVIITENDIQQIFNNFNMVYKVNDINIFITALTHTSYVKKDEEYWKTHRSKNTNKNLDPILNPILAIPLRNESFEELEYVGDSVIHCVLANYIQIRYKGQGEGFFTKLRTKIENGDTLAQFCKAIKLNEFILISRYIEKNGGRYNNNKIMEDAFEAFIGAMLRDSKEGFLVCNKFLINLIEREIDFAELIYVETNFKDKLLQYFHIKKWFDPQYNKINVVGPDHNRTFTMSVSVKKSENSPYIVCGIGSGLSKKKGEQEAAKNALIKFGEL